MPESPEVRFDAPIRRWCDARAIPGRRADLSDDAALLIAAGRLGAETATVVRHRLESGRGFPDLGGYGRLRRLARIAARHEESTAVTAPPPAPRNPLLAARDAADGLRSAEARRKLKALRRSFTLSRGVFAAGVRAMRRDRRDDLHLSLDQRDELFAALLITPVPLTPSPAAAAAAVVARAAAPVLRLAADYAPVSVTEWVQWHRPGEERVTAFETRYEVLLYLAGAVFDKVTDSRAASAGLLDEQLMQLDLATDLVQIASDVHRLEQVWGQLRRAPGLAYGARAGELDKVWDELVERVLALTRVADLVDVADRRHRPGRPSVEAIDAQINELVQRAGQRELSTDGARRVASQLAYRVDDPELRSAVRRALPGAARPGDAAGDRSDRSDAAGDRSDRSDAAGDRSDAVGDDRPLGGLTQPRDQDAR